MQRRRKFVWGGLTETAEKRRAAEGRGKGRVNPSQRRAPKSSERTQESLPKRSAQRDRGEQQNGKDQRPLQENERYQRNIQAKMGSIKDRNGVDLTEVEDIKKRWQEYMEELYNKDLHNPDNHDDVITNLEPDILECEVKQALESITMNKASGGNGIPVELFQILKDDAVKVLHSICQQIWKTPQWPQDWKR